jgi:hypothetical protein
MCDFEDLPETVATADWGVDIYHKDCKSIGSSAVHRRYQE